MALYLRYAVRSDLGLVRNNNEDSVYAGPRLLAIADGMGGHAAGEVASKIVIGTLEPLDEDRRLDDLMGVAARRRRRGEPPHRRRGEAAQRARGHGHDAHRAALRRLAGRAGARRRLAGVPAARPTSSPRSPTTTPTSSTSSTPASSRRTRRKDHPRKSVILRALLGTEVEPDVSIREARGRRPLPALLRRAVRRRVRPRRSPTRCRSTTRRSAPTGWSSWRCAAAARTT